MLKSFPWLRSSWLPLVLIVLVAAFTRLWNIGVTEYRFDEAQLSRLAFETLAGTPPQAGLPASIGIPAPPTMAFIVAVPYLFTRSPLVVTAMIALWNVFGCALLWLLCRRYLAPKAAFAAGLIYAVTPWALLYSRKIWPPDLHTPFLLMALLLGFYGFRDGKRWAQVLCLPVLTIPIHIHYGAAVFLPLYLWLLWTGRKQIHWGEVVASVGLSLVLLLPFVGMLPEVMNSIDSLRQAKSEGGFSPTTEGFGFLAQFAAGWGVDVRLAGDDAGMIQTASAWSPLWGLLLGGLTLAGLVGLLRFYRPIAAFLLLWAFLPAVVLASGVIDVYEHYLILSLPALCVLAGIGVEVISRFRMGELPLGRWAAVGTLILALVGQFAWWTRLLDVLDQTWVSSFGTPLHYIETTRSAMSSADDVLIFNADRRHSAWTWTPLLYPNAECVREVIIAEGGIFLQPEGSFTAFIPTDIDAYPLIDRYQNTEPVVISLREGEAPFTLYPNETVEAWPGELTSIPPAWFDNGAALTGYRLTADRIELAWQLDRTKSADDYQYFTHFYDVAGERISQRDTSFYPGRYWCAGDSLVTWIDHPVPAGAAFMRVGMYRLEEGGIAGSSVVDDMGNPVGGWVDVLLGG